MSYRLLLYISVLSGFQQSISPTQSAPAYWTIQRHPEVSQLRLISPEMQRAARNRIANDIITNIINQYSMIHFIKPYELHVELINVKKDIFEIILSQSTIDKKTYKPITYFIRFNYSAKTQTSFIVDTRLP